LLARPASRLSPRVKCLATKCYAKLRERKFKRANAILPQRASQLLKKGYFVAKNAFRDIIPPHGGWVVATN
jgi:hypothetical protein